MTVTVVSAVAGLVLLAAAYLVGRRRGRRCAVYFLFGERRRFFGLFGRRPLYVGKSTAPALRFEQHRVSQPWWPKVDPALTRVVWCRSERAALRKEARAIRYGLRWGRPVYNDVHNRNNPHRVPVYRPRRARVSSSPQLRRIHR